MKTGREKTGGGRQVREQLVGNLAVAKTEQPQQAIISSLAVLGLREDKGDLACTLN